MKAPFQIFDLSGAEGRETRHPKVEANEVIQLTIVHCIMEAELISCLLFILLSECELWG